MRVFTFRERLELRWQALMGATLCRLVDHRWRPKMYGRLCRRCGVFQSR